MTARPPTPVKLKALQWMLVLGALWLGYSIGFQCGLVPLAGAAIIALSITLRECDGEAAHPQAAGFYKASRHPGLTAMLLAGLVFLACWPALKSEFLADDFAHVRLFHQLSLADFLKLFTTDFSQGIWRTTSSELRPFSALFYRLQFLAFGTDAVGYHALDIAVHILNTCLVFQLVRALSSNGAAIAVTAALFFGLAPLHDEPISWISGARSDAYPAFFYLLSVCAFVRFQNGSHPASYVLAWLSFIVGLFTKEILGTLPLLLLAYAFLLNPRGEQRLLARFRSCLLVCVPFLVALSAYLWWRWWLFGSIAKNERFDWMRLSKLFREEDLSLRHLLFPLQVALEPSRQGQTELARAVALMCVAFLLGILWAATWFWWNRRKQLSSTASVVLGFGLLWYLLSHAPLAFTYFSVRHLYLPSVGFYIALSAWLIPHPEEIGKRRLHLAAICGWIALFGGILFQRAKAWGEIGELSRQMRQAVQRLEADVPEGSWLMLNVPDSVDGKFAWIWSQPFALQPPFAQQDHYARLEILESPMLHCCPIEDWWSSRWQRLARLLSLELPEYVELYNYGWDPRRRTPELKKILVSRRDLATRFQARMKHPVAELGTPDWGSAFQLWDSLQTPLRFPQSNRSFLEKDLTRAFLDGEASVGPEPEVYPGSPNGKRAFAFKFPRSGEERPALVTLSNSRLSFPISVPRDASLRFGIALVEDPPDAVEARVTFRKSTGIEHLIFFQELNPLTLKEDRFWQDCQVDLASFGNQAGEIVLEAREAHREKRAPVRLGWSGLEIVRIQ